MGGGGEKLEVDVRVTNGPWQEEEIPDNSGSGEKKKTKFSRLAFGLELWDMLTMATELMYEPELQVRWVTMKAQMHECKWSN